MRPLLLFACMALAGCSGDPPAAASPAPPREPASQPTPEPSPEEPDPTPEATPAPLPRYETRGQVTVREAADVASRRVGLLMDCAVVAVTEQQEGPGCEAPWAALAERGWICLDHAAPTQSALPTDHPLLAFDPPTPEELAAYRKDGTFDRATGPAAEALLPFAYGRVAGRHAGRCYADVEAARDGAAPVGTLDATRRQHFTDVVETEDGAFLKRPDGTVVPLDDVYLYAPSRFQGEDLVEDPSSDARPAWVRRGGANLRDGPSMESTVLDQLPARAALRVGEAEDRWVPLRRADDAPAEGWVAASRLRRVRLVPPPDDVAGDDVWVDVDLDQQVLTVLRGPAPLFATMVSTGTAGHATPLGLYRIGDKMLHWDMASRSGADDPYHLEEVPWVLHFWPRYALHGAFWHDGFGDPRSHGCVNLAPKDARTVFDLTEPRVPPGWHSAWESPDHPGSLVRVRRDSGDVPDRRSRLE